MYPAVYAAFGDYVHGASQPIKAAVNTRRTLNVKDIHIESYAPKKPTMIEVKSEAPKFMIHFNSASSKVNIFHEHRPAEPKSVKETFSEDEPHILKTEVVKPIIQEIHEVITPYRRVVQEIKPVEEIIQTLVSRRQADGSGVSGGSFAFTGNSLTGNSLTSPRVSRTTPLPLIPDSKPSTGGSGGADLVLTEDEVIDNSLYNGNNELDLKYVSPNKPTQSNLYKDHYYGIKLYKDR